MHFKSLHFYSFIHSVCQKITFENLYLGSSNSHIPYRLSQAHAGRVTEDTDIQDFKELTSTNEYYNRQRILKLLFLIIHFQWTSLCPDNHNNQGGSRNFRKGGRSLLLPSPSLLSLPFPSLSPSPKGGRSRLAAPLNPPLTITVYSLSVYTVLPLWQFMFH